MVLAMLLGSVVIHAILLPVGNKILATAWNAPPLPLAGGLMEVSLLEPQEDEEDEDKQPEETPELDKPKGKLINQDPPEREERPDASDFLSEFDRRVERESRAPRSPKPSASSQESRKSPQQDGSPPTPPNKPSSKPAKAAEGKTPATRGTPSDPDVSDSEDGELSRSSEVGETMDARAEDRADGESGNPQIPNPGAPNLRGSKDALRQLFGRPSIDDLRDVEPGDETLVNSKRWKYASFFNRVRDQIAQHWDPVSVRRARDPDGTRWGSRTRTTRLLISLNPDGSLKRVSVERSCGIQELDTEAIRAVRSAHPFNNPPRQLIDPKTGLIEFTFGFILEFDGSPRIFRIRR